ncbi:MAG: hypothetical protein R3348_08915, partial [Xanthomonadales bacterium]|nr:hypothetical protein [Xanthomonadales bacterium]
CAYCVFLRGNLLLLMPLGLVAAALVSERSAEHSRRAVAPGTLAAGMLLSLAALSWFQAEFSGRWNPLPLNGGVVLHQVYNEQNPRAESHYPDFTAYSNPVDIARGYAQEAERRAGQPLTETEIDAYWRREALDYIRQHPLQTVRNVLRKAGEFASVTEVANNRSLTEERIFSPVLRWLPPPFGYLLVFGLPGLLIAAREDRRALLAWVPVVTVLATFALFFAEARFRFHVVPLLALGAGITIQNMLRWARSGHADPILKTGVLMAGLVAVSAWATRAVPPPSISWDAAAWGYIRMGDYVAAERLLENPPTGWVPNAKWEEGLGFISWSQGNHGQAAHHYRRAIKLNPASHVAHYNLALMLQHQRNHPQALLHARRALALAPLPEYHALVEALGGP